MVYYFVFFHVYGLNKSRIGKSSNLPASISKIRTIFDRTEKSAKLPVGPTTSSPGPMLFKQAITAVKLVVESKLSREIRNTETTSVMI